MFWTPILAALGAGATGYLMSKTKPRKYQIGGTIAPYSSLTEIPVGKELNQRILDALAGKGDLIGFPEGYVQRSTSPFVEQLKADYPEVERKILEQFGAAGLARSSLMPRQVTKARRQLSRDINQIIAEAYLKDLAQRKADIARYENLADLFAQQEADQLARYAAWKRGEQLANIGLSQDYDRARNQYLGRLIGMPLAIGQSILTGQPAFSLGTSSGTVSALSRLLELVESAQRASQSSPFTRPIGAGAGRNTLIGFGIGG
ncbi:MAG: hypothetical protein DRP74_08510 [Candidatus Omnitrophota bacterium]|nr:MAG: hypothetical protein DRP74_08510 [Candidatus Omnitrophota bacterium]